LGFAGHRPVPDVAEVRTHRAPRIVGPSYWRAERANAEGPGGTTLLGPEPSSAASRPSPVPAVPLFEAPATRRISRESEARAQLLRTVPIAVADADAQLERLPVGRGHGSAAASEVPGNLYAGLGKTAAHVQAPATVPVVRPRRNLAGSVLQGDRGAVRVRGGFSKHRALDLGLTPDLRGEAPHLQNDARVRVLSVEQGDVDVVAPVLGLPVGDVERLQLHLASPLCVVVPDGLLERR